MNSSRGGVSMFCGMPVHDKNMRLTTCTSASATRQPFFFCFLLFDHRFLLLLFSCLKILSVSFTLSLARLTLYRSSVLPCELFFSIIFFRLLQTRYVFVAALFNTRLLFCFHACVCVRNFILFYSCFFFFHYSLRAAYANPH